MTTKIMVILLSVTKGSEFGIGREELDSIRNFTYDSIENIRKAVGVEECGVICMFDFMELCNNSDPSNENLNEGEFLDIGETWIGYVNLIEK